MDSERYNSYSSVLPKQILGDKWVHIGTRAGNVKPSTDMLLRICTIMQD